MKRHALMVLWMALAGFTVSFAQIPNYSIQVGDGGFDAVGSKILFAGSYDGPFAGERPGTLTAILRQEGIMVSGRVAVEVTNHLIRAFELTPTPADDTRLQAMGQALDGSNTLITINATLSGDDPITLTGSFTTSDNLRGEFTIPQLTETSPPDLNGSYEGRLWNIEDNNSWFARAESRLEDQTYRATMIVTTPIGPVTGTATGILNDLGDRVENLLIVLDTPVGPLTLRGDMAVSSDGRIVFSALRTEPSDPVALRGTMLLRRL